MASSAQPMAGAVAQPAVPTIQQPRQYNLGITPTQYLIAFCICLGLLLAHVYLHYVLPRFSILPPPQQYLLVDRMDLPSHTFSVISPSGRMQLMSCPA
jgi:hypothetical protein